MKQKENNQVYKIALTGLFAALAYVVFTFLQFKIQLPGGEVISIHLGNAVCVIGALLLGGFYGGLGGAIGMTIGDLFDPIYVLEAPKTFILKLCIGLIVGFVAHKMGKINQLSDKKHIVKWTIIAAVSALTFNAVFAPIAGYFYKLLILGRPAAQLTLGWNFAIMTINAVICSTASVVVYLPLRDALKKAGLFNNIS